MPWTFRHPGKEWTLFLDDVREVLGTSSANVAYTGIEGVFRAFRARLTVPEALAFAQVLPSVPRALFVQAWDPGPPLPWADRQTYLAEVKALRKDHNLAGDRAIEAVSYALHRALRPPELQRVLARLGPGAEAFWAIEGYSAAQISPGIR